MSYRKRTIKRSQAKKISEIKRWDRLQHDGKTYTAICDAEPLGDRDGLWKVWCKDDQKIMGFPSEIVQLC